jgi:hypothetical protein
MFKSLRKLGMAALVIGLLVLAAVIYNDNHPSKPHAKSPATTYRTFKVKRTATIAEDAGTITLRFSQTLRVVLAVSATGDKANFDLKCLGRSQLVHVATNNPTVAIVCNLQKVLYSDSSANTGIVVWQPKR